MVDVGISSTRQIARSWGIAQLAAAREAAANTIRGPHSPISEAVSAGGVEQAREVPRVFLGVDVGQVIEDAIRTAGLMK